MLEEANAFVLEQRKNVNEFYKPLYHFSPPCGWMNDPNGLVYFRGEYHVFYQFHPYSSQGGLMYWGHAKSRNFTTWEHLPVALAPDAPYDKNGCWSGGAIVIEDVLYLIYTGHYDENGERRQTQNIAFSRDGIHFEKYEGNPVISAPPAEGSSDFRDPKVWKHEGNWYMVVGSGKDGIGKALLYRYSDLRNWDYVGVLAESDGTLGYMWECPDFFPVGDKYVLMFSPMGMGEKKAIYLVGDMDYSTGKFTWQTIGDTDIGFDYYAPQSLLDDSGRRIIIGWLNGWDWMPWFKDWAPEKVKTWCGAMSIPRVVELDGAGGLTFRPVEEMKSLRGQHNRVEELRVDNGSQSLPADNGYPLEMIVTFRLKDTSAARFGLILRGAGDGSQQTVIAYDASTGELSADRSGADDWSEGVQSVRLKKSGNGLLSLHLFVDASNVELYTENYGTAITFNIYPDPEHRTTAVFAEEGSAVVESLDIWQLSRAL